MAARRIGIPGLILAALLALTSCDSEPDASRPTLVEGVEMNGGTDVLITGTVAIVHGCIGLNDGSRAFAVVWPRGTQYANDSDTTVRLPDGRTVAVGDDFEGAGGWEHADSPLVPAALPADAQMIASPC